MIDAPKLLREPFF